MYLGLYHGCESLRKWDALRYGIKEYTKQPWYRQRFQATCFLRLADLETAVSMRVPQALMVKKHVAIHLNGKT